MSNKDGIEKKSEFESILEVQPQPVIKKIYKMKKIKIGTQMEVPDGGYGWVVVLAAVFITMWANATLPAFGILFSWFFIEHNVSATTIGFLLNIHGFMVNSAGIFVAPLCAEYGRRKVAFVAGLFIAVGLVVTGYVERVEYMFISYAVVTGFCQGIVMFNAFTIVPLYFDKWKGIASGLTFSGNCIGIFIGPLLSFFCINEFGFKGAFLIFGGISLNICVASLFFHPVKWHMKPKIEQENEFPLVEKDGQKPQEILKPFDSISNASFTSANSFRRFSHALEISASAEIKTQIQRPTLKKQRNSQCQIFYTIFKSAASSFLLLKWHRIKIITFTMGLIIVALINMLSLIPFHMKELGYPMESRSWSISTIGIANLFTRILVTGLTDFLPFSNKYIYMANIFLLFATMLGFSFVESYTNILIILSFFGSSVGACVGMLAVVVIEFVGLEHLPQTLGLCGIMSAILLLTVGPLLGILQDAVKNYALVIRLLSIGPFLGLLFWFFMPYAQRRDARISEKKHKMDQDI